MATATTKKTKAKSTKSTKTSAKKKPVKRATTTKQTPQEVIDSGDGNTLWGC